MNYDENIHAKKLYNKLKMKEKADLLRISEMKILIEEGKVRDGIEPSSIKCIVPRLKEMTELAHI